MRFFSCKACSDSFLSPLEELHDPVEARLEFARNGGYFCQPGGEYAVRRRKIWIYSMSACLWQVNNGVCSWLTDMACYCFCTLPWYIIYSFIYKANIRFQNSTKGKQKILFFIHCRQWWMYELDWTMEKFCFLAVAQYAKQKILKSKIVTFFIESESTFFSRL